MTAAFFTKDEIAEYDLSERLPTNEQVNISVSKLLDKLDKQIYNSTNIDGSDVTDTGSLCNCGIYSESGAPGVCQIPAE